jgi:hypothetical protein
MLNENHLEQDNRVNTRSAVVGAIQVLYKIVDILKVHRALDFAQQMALRH